MGQRLLKSLGSEPGFLRQGLSVSHLKEVGTIPVDSEEWIMADMRESREGRQDLLIGSDIIEG